MNYNPKHPVTKRELVGGFNPLDVSRRPFGYRHTVTDMPTMTIATPACYCPRPLGKCLPDCVPPVS